MEKESTLYHFTDHDSLISIIESKFFRPSYCIEKIDFIDLSKLDSIAEYKFLQDDEIAYPMVCFADLLPEELDKHRVKYKKFGFEMHKMWAISNHISPVIYATKNMLTSDGILVAAINLLTSKRTNQANNFTEKSDEKEHSLKMIISFLMSFFKSYEGYSYCKTKKEFHSCKEIFYYEREWRYVPLYLDNCELCLNRNDYENREIFENQRTKILNEPKNKLCFKWDDICKIHIPQLNDKSVIEALCNSFKISKEEASSKIFEYSYG